MPFRKPFSKELTRSKRLEKAAQRNGFRQTFFHPNGSTYIGDWKNDKKSDKGMFISKSGTSVYEGNFENNVLHGFCVSTSVNTSVETNTVIRGNYIRGKLGRDGVIQQQNGTVYKGILRNGKREGYGCLWFANGDFYAGDFFRDKCHGLGMFVHVNGNRYEGEWNNGLKHGEGRFFHLDSGVMQEGVWVNGTCVRSIFMDIPFRNRALHPTAYPIQKLAKLNKVAESSNVFAADNAHHCLSLPSSTEEEEEEIEEEYNREEENFITVYKK